MIRTVPITGDWMRAALRGATAAVPLTRVRDWAAQDDAQFGFGLDVHRELLQRGLDADAVPVSPTALASSLAAAAGIGDPAGVEFHFLSGLPVLLGAHTCELRTFTATAGTVVLRGFLHTETHAATTSVTLRPRQEGRS
jgi:hypothetical protein